jgi:hypothetical protein
MHHLAAYVILVPDMPRKDEVAINKPVLYEPQTPSLPFAPLVLLDNINFRASPCDAAYGHGR